MTAPTSRPATRFVWLLLLVLLAALANVVAWWWPNRPVQVGHAPYAVQEHVVESMSFAPFRRGQSPLTKTYPTAEQVTEDLQSLQGLTRGIRTYTAREGLEVVPPVAQKLGINVMQCVWLGPERDINEKEVAAAIELANRYPDAIKSLVVGNEVLLRKDLPVDEVIGYIRKVKAAVKQPVTYADVWEFWLRFPQLLNEVDFVTVHFLPYWEDLPIAASHSMPHILEVYREVKAKLPGKPITIGEVGWPSEGRSRRDAIPSRTEAAGFIADFMQLAQKEGLSYNLVEAFDQPWKVKLEGTVGGAWGVLNELRQPKFEVGGLVSNLPEWPLFAGLGVLLALILLVLHAQAVAKLPTAGMAAAVAFAQVQAALLSAAIERGLEYNFSLVHQIEFGIAILLLGIFALLLFRRLLVLLARSAKAAAKLAEALRKRDAHKLYWALVMGVPEQRMGKIDLPLAKLAGGAGERMVYDEDEGKNAVSLYRTIETAGKRAAWLGMAPLTGRTHQLRVHAAAMGTPIVGDGKYGGAEAFLTGGVSRKLHLHARGIKLAHPDGGKLEVRAPLSPHMAATWDFLGLTIDKSADAWLEE
jgi:exo-beta-1,3-glucanase (GH17 family)